MSQIICPGCYQPFSHGAWSLHIAQTDNSPCRTIYNEQRAYLPGTEINNNAPPPNDNIFAGDFFGDDYDNEEFPGWEADRDLPSDQSSDSESDWDDMEDNDDWGVEPPISVPASEAHGLQPDILDPMDDEQGHPLTPEEREHAAEGIQTKPIVVRYPSTRAGEAVQHAETSGYEAYSKQLGEDNANPYAPFKSKMDWDFARWTKLRGPGSTAATELMSMDGYQERLGLSYKNTNELNNIIDGLPSRPKFMHSKITVGDETLDLYHRDILECVRALFGDPEFSPHLVFVPERHYADQNKTQRIYSDLHTGKWWWNTQKVIDKLRVGGTIIPIFISSDKTLLTLFRNKSAYPVYLTIGNLPKDIRRKPSRHGQILLGYLPTSRLESFPTTASKKRGTINLFHACLSHILAPLRNAGVEGVYMRTGNGSLHRTHPIFATFVGDYPEQLLVTCCKQFRCPKCEVEPNDLGDDRKSPLRNLLKIFEALDVAPQGPTAYRKACKEVGIKAVVDPFWEHLPFVNIFISITPDILHQLYQGVIKHVVGWLISAFGETEIDARCRRLPPNHNLRHFSKGISTLSRVTGQEHSDMCRILLGLIVDLRLPGNKSTARLIRAVRALLDFLYIARYPSQTTSTLGLLKDALTRFHNNKQVFIDLGIRNHFNLPKLHSLQHYVDSIELFGTTDNYNTETSERLHIDLAKDAYRATNHKDEYSQMTRWLDRREKIHRHELFINWRLSGQNQPLQTPPQPTLHAHIKMTKWPTITSVPLHTIIAEYGAQDFRQELAVFVANQNYPGLTPVQLRNTARNVILPFQRLPIFHKIKFWNSDPFLHQPNRLETLDIAHVRPRQKAKGRDQWQSGRFDTVLVNLRGLEDDGQIRRSGVHRFRVAQLRAVFRLPDKASSSLFRPHVPTPKHLAYVEWFTEFRDTPEAYHLMYKITRSMKDGKRVASIIPVSDIERTVVLFPRFGSTTPREWTTHNVLEECLTFYVNPFTDAHSYLGLY